MRLTVCALVLTQVLGIGIPASAKAEAPTATNQMRKLIATARIPTTISALNVIVLAAHVHFRHEEQNDIQVNADKPGHWAVEGGTIRQTDIAASCGIKVANDEIYVGGKKQTSDPNGLLGEFRRNGKLSISGNSIGCTNGEVYINGKKVSTAGDADKESTDTDVLEVVLPLSFRGGLDLNASNCMNSGDVHLDGWKGGDVTFRTGLGHLEASGPLVDIGNFSLLGGSLYDLTLGGGSKFREIYCQNFELEMTAYDLDIQALKTRTLTIEQRMQSHTTIHGGSAESGLVTDDGSCEVLLHGDFDSIRHSTFDFPVGPSPQDIEFPPDLIGPKHSTHSNPIDISPRDNQFPAEIEYR